MKKSSIMPILFLISLFETQFIWSQEEEQKPRVAIIIMKNTEGDERLDPICSTVTDTVELSLRLMGQYRLVRADYLDPQEKMDAAKIFFNDFNIDNAIFGRAYMDDGEYVLSMSVYDRSKDQITINKEERVHSVLDIFEASDNLAISLIEAFSGIHIGFGELLLVNEGERGDYLVYIDGSPAGENLASMSVLAGKRKVEIRRKIDKGETILFSKQVEVKENETKRISFTLTSETLVQEEPQKEEDVELVEKEIPPEPKTISDRELAQQAAYSIQGRLRNVNTLGSLRSARIEPELLNDLQLDYYVKQSLFNRLKKDNSGIAFLVNFLAPGVGSMVQGNIGGGVYVLLSNFIFYGYLYGSLAAGSIPFEDTPILGLTITTNLLIATVVNLVSPFTFQHTYNNVLRDKLNY